MRLKLTFFDPILLFLAKELVAVITVILLYRSNIISFELYFIFFYTYCSWALMNLAFALVFSAPYKRKVMQLISSEFFLNRKSIRTLFTLAVILTVITGLLSFFLSLGGDKRLDFWSAFRAFEPILFVCSTFTLFYVYKIYNQTGSLIYMILFGMIIVGSMMSGGKSAIFGILPFLNFYYFSKGTPPALGAIVSIFIFCTVGVLTSIVLIYGYELASALSFLLFRIKSDADVYFLIGDSYSDLNISSFIRYYLGAFLKVLGLGGGVSENIGAQIGSYFAGTEVSTGPNAHLPIIFYVIESQSERIAAFLTFISIYFFVYLTMFHLFLKVKSIIFVWVIFVLINYRFNTFFDIASISLYWLEGILFIFFALVVRFILRKGVM